MKLATDYRFFGSSHQLNLTNAIEKAKELPRDGIVGVSTNRQVLPIW